MGHQHLWFSLPKQAQVPGLLAQAMQREPRSRSFPLPCSFQDFLENRPWNGPPQDPPWCRCFGSPQALRVLRLRPGRRFTRLGRLSHEVGWKYQDTIKALEEKRKVRAAAYYERKKATAALQRKANEQARAQFATPLLQQTGY